MYFKCQSAWVAKCPSTLSVWVPKCPSIVRVTPVPKCTNDLSARVSKFSWSTQVALRRRSAQVTFDCSRILGVPWECPLSSQFPYQSSSCKIGRESFLSIFQNTYLHTILTGMSFFWNNVFKFYHILLTRCNHLREFQKLFLSDKYFIKFQKTEYKQVWSSLLSKFVILQLQFTVLLLQL